MKAQEEEQQSNREYLQLISAMDKYEQEAQKKLSEQVKIFTSEDHDQEELKKLIPRNYYPSPPPLIPGDRHRITVNIKCLRGFAAWSRGYK